MNAKGCMVGAVGMLMGCGLAYAAQRGGPTPQELEALSKAMGAMAQQNQQTATAAVDFRQLKALLPAKVGTMARTNAKGEKNTAMGITVAVAEGQYSEKDSSAEVKITDMGGMGGIGALAQFGMSMDVDNESDTGYEKTYAYKGLKVHEKYDTENKSGELQVMVGGRFMVEIHVNEAKADLMKQALDAIDLDKLAKLKPEAPVTK